MTRLNVIPFEPEHLQQMTLLPDERETILNNAAFLYLISQAKHESVAFCGTAYWGNEILCIGGWYAKAPLTCQLFIIPDAEMLKRHPSVFARTTIKWRKRVEEFTYARLQAVALPGMTDWMQVIGFEFESVIENYNNTGKAYEMWSKTL